MEELKWSYQQLTDSDLSAKLNDIHQEQTFRKVDIRNNRLESIPNLNKYQQFQHLQALNLSSNNISSVETLYLCPCMKVLDVSENRISELGDLSQCHRLEVLLLGNNKIEFIEPSELPITIKVLDIHNNQLTELRDFSGHKELTKLNLSGNKIIKIYDVNRDISFWEIDTFGESFFETECGYNLLIMCHFDTKYLIQPPQEVFKSGLKSIQTYFKNMALSKKVNNSRKRFVILDSAHLLRIV